MRIVLSAPRRKDKNDLDVAESDKCRRAKSGRRIACPSPRAAPCLKKRTALDADIGPDVAESKDCRRAKSARTKLTPVELAAQWGKKPSSIIALIRGGELPAIDVSVSRGKPRFLIDLADIAIFEERRAVRPPEPAARRRRRAKTEPEGIKYF